MNPQFAVRKRHVRRPKWQGFIAKFTISTIKRSPSQMFWGVIWANMGLLGCIFSQAPTWMAWNMLTASGKFDCAHGRAHHLCIYACWSTVTSQIHTITSLISILTNIFHLCFTAACQNVTSYSWPLFRRASFGTRLIGNFLLRAWSWWPNRNLMWSHNGATHLNDVEVCWMINIYWRYNLVWS